MSSSGYMFSVGPCDIQIGRMDTEEGSRMMIRFFTPSEDGRMDDTTLLVPKGGEEAFVAHLTTALISVGAGVVPQTSPQTDLVALTEAMAVAAPSPEESLLAELLAKRAQASREIGKQYDEALVTELVAETVLASSLGEIPLSGDIRHVPSGPDLHWVYGGFEISATRIDRTVRPCPLRLVVGTDGGIVVHGCVNGTVVFHEEDIVPLQDVSVNCASPPKEGLLKALFAVLQHFEYQTWGQKGTTAIFTFDNGYKPGIALKMTGQWGHSAFSPKPRGDRQGPLRADEVFTMKDGA